MFFSYTAVQLARHRDEEPEVEENALLRLMERVLPTTTEYDGAKVVTRISGKRVVTPLLLVMIAIGSTDVLFALGSITAIFDLTKEPYIVFSLRKAANEPTAIARVTPHVGEDRRKIPVDVPGTPDRD